MRWSGPWSDGSAEWAAHPDVAKAVGYQEIADGLFWMELEDFLAAGNRPRWMPCGMAHWVKTNFAHAADWTDAASSGSAPSS